MGLTLLIIPMVLLRATLAWPHARGLGYARWWFCWGYCCSMSFTGAFQQWFLAKNVRTGGNSAQGFAKFWPRTEGESNRTYSVQHAKVLRCVLSTSSSW